MENTIEVNGVRFDDKVLEGMRIAIYSIHNNAVFYKDMGIWNYDEALPVAVKHFAEFLGLKLTSEFLSLDEIMELSSSEILEK